MPDFCGYICGIPKDDHQTEEHPWEPMPIVFRDRADLTAALRPELARIGFEYLDDEDVAATFVAHMLPVEVCPCGLGPVGHTFAHMLPEDNFMALTDALAAALRKPYGPSQRVRAAAILADPSFREALTAALASGLRRHFDGYCVPDAEAEIHAADIVAHMLLEAEK